MRIAIDFDGCLDNYKIQVFAKKAIAENNDVWVLTKRREGKYNEDLKEVLKLIRLSEVKVIYTDGKRKAEILSGLNFDLFIDNDTKEFDTINNYSNTLALPFYENSRQ